MPASRAVRGCSIEKTYFYGTLCAYAIAVKRLPVVLASVVKWISHQPSKLLLGVRIPPEAQSKAGRDITTAHRFKFCLSSVALAEDRLKKIF